MSTETQKGKLTFERLPIKYYPAATFRERTQMWPLDMNFLMINGGMGDYLTWLRPIQWLAECATWINGTLIHPLYLEEIVKYCLAPYPEWKHVNYKETQSVPKIDDKPFRGPANLATESLNATGAHLSTCGWVYFTNKEKAPKGVDKFGHPWDAYPKLYQDHLDKVELPELAKTLEPKKYAVMTTGVTTNTRRVKPEYWVPIIQYVKSLGLTPVFLGKSTVETGNARNIHTEYSDTLISMGVNLLNQTTLMQAASIMSRAAMVVGLDNGLLHLAGCTEVPIVFGYTLASPDHREPRRPVGKTYNVVLEQKELACYHCQSHNNFVVGFNFRECFYGDLKCVDMLYDNDGARWKKQIDLALSESK